MQVNGRTMCKIGLLLLIIVCVPLYGEQEKKAPPKDLIQYIQDASRLGLSEAQIQENAVRAGWAAAVVSESIAHVRNSSAAPGAPATATPAATPPAGDAQPSPSAAPTSAPTAEPPDEPAAPGDYHIGAGDVLQISVWKEPEASVPSVVVRPDGRIGLPLLKEVEVVGLTPRQAEKMLTAKLSRLIPAADVTVVVTGINSKKIYIVGAVKKEGPIPYNYRMTVMQAISEAGGLNDYAKRKKIYILRTDNGKDYKLPFDYDSALRGERMELNIPMMPGDTLVVPH